MFVCVGRAHTGQGGGHAGSRPGLVLGTAGAAGCVLVPQWQGHEATDTGLAYAPVSQAHGHHHIGQCFSLLHCSADQF